MKQFLKLLISLTTSSLFYGLIYLIFNNINLDLPFIEGLPFLTPVIIMIIVSFVLGFIFYLFFSEFVVIRILKLEGIVEERLINMNFGELIFSVAGCILGLGVGNLLGLPFANLPVIGTIIVIILNVVLGFMGIRVASKRKDDFSFFNKSKSADKAQKVYGRPKVLDTSVIIDGRILDILQTGFIEGKLIIPDFVLEELRHIADSSDNLKRNRGRRGLDILNEIQKQVNVPVEIYNWDSKDPDDVDTKLLKMGAKLDAFVVTNDFNLNKVAEFQKVSVLNINDLSRSVKSVVLPGENMQVSVIKDGKENHQGIAYLEDG
ncbi:MAG: PIN/TRAM domain-containing protein, partial [Clostridiales bacterium]|nr:PIN/TRAM domain-containing protein [Clostridiales bacterium]